MAEQSSTVVVFRALIMLICLILIPVAAFCGGSFPAVVKAIQSGRWPTLADFRGPSGPPTTMNEAPRFMPAPATGSPRATDPKTLGFSGPVACLGSAPQGETSPSSVVAANYTAPITPPRNETGATTGFPQEKDLGMGSNRRLSPLPPGTDHLLSVDPELPGSSAHSVAPAGLSGPAGGSSPNNQLKYVLDRLQKLGATYFVLEPCGDEKREFRFFCRMSIGGNPRVTQPFWCFDSDPLRAMTQVLKQVEDWQSGGG